MAASLHQNIVLIMNKLCLRLCTVVPEIVHRHAKASFWPGEPLHLNDVPKQGPQHTVLPALL